MQPGLTASVQREPSALWVRGRPFLRQVPSSRRARTQEGCAQRPRLVRSLAKGLSYGPSWSVTPAPLIPRDPKDLGAALVPGDGRSRWPGSTVGHPRRRITASGQEPQHAAPLLSVGHKFYPHPTYPKERGGPAGRLGKWGSRTSAEGRVGTTASWWPFCWRLRCFACGGRCARRVCFAQPLVCGQGLPGPDAALGIERRKPHRSRHSLLMSTFSLTQKHNRSYLPSKAA